jgi:hypothetical protein
MRFIIWTFLLFIYFFWKHWLLDGIHPGRDQCCGYQGYVGAFTWLVFRPDFSWIWFRYFIYVLGWYNFLLLIRALVFWLYFQTVFRLCIFTQAKQGQTRASHIRKMCVEKQVVYILQLLSANILFSHYLIELDSSTRWISSLFLFLLCQYFDPIISHPDSNISVLHMWW